jgi:antitoxin HigA-1
VLGRPVGGSPYFLAQAFSELIPVPIQGTVGTPVKNPPHPGRSIKDACLDALGLSVTEGARILGVARHTLSRVINGQAGISPEMAIRLEKAGWLNADHWLRLQTAHDLAQARQHQDRIKVKAYKPSRAA